MLLRAVVIGRQSFCWKINFLPSNINNKSVLLKMFLKLMIEVVAFFLGHPVYASFVQRGMKKHGSLS